MRRGSVPASRSRATRSVSTRVLPEPALADSQVDRAGSAAAIWARVASSSGVTARPPAWAWSLRPTRRSARGGRSRPRAPPAPSRGGRCSRWRGRHRRGSGRGSGRVSRRGRSRGPPGRSAWCRRRAEADVGDARDLRRADLCEPAFTRHDRLEEELLVEGADLLLRRDRAGLVVVDRDGAVRVAVDPVGLGRQREGGRRM
jgi:hypothetical protein